MTSSWSDFYAAVCRFAKKADAWLCYPPSEELPDGPGTLSAPGRELPSDGSARNEMISDRAMRAIERVLKREGGFSDRPEDRGGPTNFGITHTTLRKWREVPVAVSDVENLTKQEAIDIYHAWYIEDPNLEEWFEAEWLFEYVFDMFVNHPPADAAKILQRAACVIDDGIIGPVTAEAANRADPVVLKRALDHQRHLYYADIVINDHSQLANLRGWINRIYEVAA